MSLVVGRRIRGGLRQLYAGLTLLSWIGVLLVVSLSMSGEQAAVRHELSERQDDLQELDQILRVVREGVRLGCRQAEDFRHQLEARRFHTLLTPGSGRGEAMRFTIALRFGRDAWLRIEKSQQKAWLASTGLVSGYQEIELRSFLHPTVGLR